MKKLILLPILFCLLVLFSCRTSSKHAFAPLHSLQALDGIYRNDSGFFSQVFGGWSKNNSYVIFDFENDETLNVTLLTDSGATKMKAYKGKYNQKKNYFEITFSNKRLITLFYNRVEIKKLRIGLDENEKLQLNLFGDEWGSLLLLFGGIGPYSSVRSMTKVEKDSILFPLQMGDKYGYRNIDNEVIIKPEYDLVLMFDGSIACVQKDNKWALIDREGKPLTSFKYSYIEPFRGKLFTQVYVRDKMGIVDRRGAEIVPVAYDKVEPLSEEYEVSVSSLDGKYGFVNSSGVLYPPVFDAVDCERIDSEAYRRKKRVLPDYIADVKLNGKTYMADSKGFLHSTIVGLYGEFKLLEETPAVYFEDVMKETVSVQESIHKSF